MTFTLSFTMGNAAFDDAPEYEIQRILRAVSERVVMGATAGRIADVNGNTIGSFAIKGKRKPE